MTVARWTPQNGSWFSLHSRKLTGENFSRISCNVAVHNLRRGSHGFCFLHYVSNRRFPTCHQSWKIFAMSFSLEDSSIKNEISSGDSSEKVLPQQFSSKKLMSLLSDSEREKLIRKLSEANQHNRFLKRQLQIKEDALLNFKSELAHMELEVQSLVTLAEEIARTGIQPGSRKINGKYIQSHLISRLEAVQKKLKGQIKDVEVVQSKEVRLLWYGMAESVQVMGSFDGWSQGESLSPEYIGSYTQFSTMLMLRPGRYEIKFLVDEEWKLSPELPTIGEGMLENNLLIVE